MSDGTDLTPHQIIIYNNPTEEPEEVARVDITGQVTGEPQWVEEFEERLADDTDSIIAEMDDGRELLRYIRYSYSTGYTIATYNSERTHEIVQELPDEEYEDWKGSVDIDTTLKD